MKKNRKKNKTMGGQTIVVPTVVNSKYSLEEYKENFLEVPHIVNRKPVFISEEIRDKLDMIVRYFGGRKMSVSGLVENIARHHLETYKDDTEEWRKL